MCLALIQEMHSVKIAKVGKMLANNHIGHASDISREILANVGKYDLQP